MKKVLSIFLIILLIFAFSCSYQKESIKNANSSTDNNSYNQNSEDNTKYEYTIFDYIYIGGMDNEEIFIEIPDDKLIFSENEKSNQDYLDNFYEKLIINPVISDEEIYLGNFVNEINVKYFEKHSPIKLNSILYIYENQYVYKTKVISFEVCQSQIYEDYYSCARLEIEETKTLITEGYPYFSNYNFFVWTNLNINETNYSKVNIKFNNYLLYNKIENSIKAILDNYDRYCKEMISNIGYSENNEYNLYNEDNNQFLVFSFRFLNNNFYLVNVFNECIESNFSENKAGSAFYYIIDEKGNIVYKCTDWTYEILYVCDVNLDGNDEIIFNYVSYEYGSIGIIGFDKEIKEDNIEYNLLSFEGL